MLSGIVLRSATVFSVSGFLVCGLAFGENGDCVEIVEWVKHVGGVGEACRWSMSVECVGGVCGDCEDVSVLLDLLVCYWVVDIFQPQCL